MSSIQPDKDESQNPFGDDAWQRVMIGNADLIRLRTTPDRLDLAREMLKETKELRATGAIGDDTEHEIRRRLMFAIEHDE